MSVDVKITGLDGIQAELRGLVPKLRVRALRNALTAGGRVVQREARRLTPVLKLSTRGGAAALRRGVRKPGTVKKAISVRTSKRATKRGDVGVFVNVRPAKGGSRGAKNPNDPFYWRWLEFGWNPATGGSRARLKRRREARIGAKRKPGAEFLQGAVKMLPAALRTFEAKLRPAIVKLNQRKAPAP